MARIEKTFMIRNAIDPDCALDGGALPEKIGGVIMKSSGAASQPPVSAFARPRAAGTASPGRAASPSGRTERTFETPLRPDVALPAADGGGDAAPAVVFGGTRAAPISKLDEACSPQVRKLRAFGRKRRSESLPPPRSPRPEPEPMWSRADLQKAKSMGDLQRADPASYRGAQTRWPRARRFFGFPVSLDPLND